MKSLRNNEKPKGERYENNVHGDGDRGGHGRCACHGTKLPQQADHYDRAFRGGWPDRCRRPYRC